MIKEVAPIQICYVLKHWFILKHVKYANLKITFTLSIFNLWRRKKRKAVFVSGPLRH